MVQIGIMQGRLSPPSGGRIQCFPKQTWAEEFPRAAAVPLDAIEWIYEVHGMEENPIATDAGLERLRDLANTHRVAVRSLCADYFMDRPLLHNSSDIRQESEKVLHWLLQRCFQAGIQRIVLPFVDDSRLETPGDVQDALALLRRALPVLEQTEVEIHLETDLSPSRFADLLASIVHPRILVNYDSGNSASNGYHPEEELACYGKRIGSVHIKDRVLHGGTVPLGEGNTDFQSLFAGLRGIRYQREFILQVARGVPGEEIGWAQHNRAFVKRYLSERPAE